jgi:hypothetical protein
MRHVLKQALRTVEVPRTGQCGEEGVACGGVAERWGYFVEQLVGAGKGGWVARVEGEDGVANKCVGGEKARFGRERVQLFAAAESESPLEECDQERGQRGAGAGHARGLYFSAQS